jgi:hypothetical protein
MVVIARPIRFAEDDPRPMLRHLDDWARRGLASPEGWGSALELCGQWVDYSARNQVLLASYGVVGPVAGAATWSLVPSTDDGRACAVRTGEHGLPVRVPVVGAAGVPSDRSRLGARSGAVVGSLRWELVFAAEQLARRPQVGALSVPDVGAMGEHDRVEAVRLASGRLLGRTPRKIGDPLEQLTTLASRITHGPGRLRLSPPLAAQSAWLIADRLSWGPGPMPPFDPSGLQRRERWQTAVDVRHASTKLLVAVSHAIGVDLTASPLPRHSEVDDRDVAPGRRNYLSPADVRALPLGIWVETGPYKRGEWLARGVAGAIGVGALLRVNDRSYLAAYETRSGALWRLETTGRGAHHGLVVEGEADDLNGAKDGARAALAERFPEAARAIETTESTPVLSRGMGWVVVPGRDERTEHRVFDERVSAMVSPGPGGRWQTLVTVDGTPRQGSLAATSDEARTTSELLAKGAMMELAAVAPDRANAWILHLSTDGPWERAGMVDVIGHRLTDADRAELATTDDPARLAEMMRSVGVLAPSTMAHVLHAEGVEASSVVELIPVLGLPIPDAIRMLHDEWGSDRLDVGIELGATVDELRAAGCSAAEMLAVAPREELRRLDTREHTWSLVGPTLLEAGYTPAEAVDHLAAHAPTPETFSAGVTTIVDDPNAAFTFARRRASAEDLAALADRFELPPTDAAQVMAAVGYRAERTFDVLNAMCPDDAAVVLDVVDHYYPGAIQTEGNVVDGEATVIEFPLSERLQAVGRSVDL